MGAQAATIVHASGREKAAMSTELKAPRFNQPGTHVGTTPPRDAKLADAIKAIEASTLGTCVHVEDGTVATLRECGWCMPALRKQVDAAIKTAKQAAAAETKLSQEKLSDQEKQAILARRPDMVLHTYESAGRWRKAKPTEKLRGGLPISAITRTIQGELQVWEPPQLRSRVMPAQRMVDMRQTRQDATDRALGYVGRTVR